jgi:hypothetical protein
MRHFPVLLIMLSATMFPTTVRGDVQNCITDGLSHILQVQELERYIDALAIAQRVVGPPWRELSIEARQDIANTMFVVLRDRLRELAGDYIGAVATPTQILQNDRYPNHYGVSGTISTPNGSTYHFDTNLYSSGSDCRFYTLVVDNAFSLRSWLPRQPAVRAAYDRHKIN